MKQIIILILILTGVAYLSQGISDIGKKFTLEKKMCGYEGYYENPCLVLTSTDFWVDQAKGGVFVSDALEENGFGISGVDWNRVLITPPKGKTVDETIGQAEVIIRNWTKR